MRRLREEKQQIEEGEARLAIEGLTESQRYILRYFVLGDRPASKVASDLKVSKQRVYELRKQVFSHLSKKSP